MLAAELGISARVAVLSTSQLDDAVSSNPLSEIARDATRLLGPCARRSMRPRRHDRRRSR